MYRRTHSAQYRCVLLTARSSNRSTPSPVMQKHLTPLTPASARKNKNKRSRPPTADERTKHSPTARTNQQREIWTTSLSPAGERSRERSRPASGAVTQRSPSPALGSPGQRSSNQDEERGSGVMSRRSSSVQQRVSTTTTHVQQGSVLSRCLILRDLDFY